MTSMIQMPSYVRDLGRGELTVTFVVWAS